MIDRTPMTDSRCHGCGVRLFDAGLDWLDQATQDGDGRLYCSPACAVEAVYPVIYPSLHGLMAEVTI